MTKPKQDYFNNNRNRFVMIQYNVWIHHKGNCPLCGKSIEWIGYARHIAMHKRKQEFREQERLMSHKNYHGCDIASPSKVD